MKTKHTVGPWALNLRYNKPFSVYGPDNLAIASWQNVKRDDIEKEANAWLIAAAPEMFEALKQYIGLYYPGYCSHGAECFHCETRRKKTEAAISKALGGEK